jgi:hypothetical protein
MQMLNKKLVVNDFESFEAMYSSQESHNDDCLTYMKLVDMWVTMLYSRVALFVSN